MIEVTHNLVPYKLMETMDDIKDARFQAFKQSLLQSFEKVDDTLWAKTYARWRKLLNESSPHDANMEIVNHNTAITLKEPHYDSMSICYAMMHLGPDEDPLNVDLNFHAEKLKQIRPSRGEVVNTVVNFMTASPVAFGGYLEVLQTLMRAYSKENSGDSTPNS